MASGKLQKGASYKPLAENINPQTATLRQLVEAHANTLSADGKKAFLSSFTGAKNQFAPIFKDYLDRPAVDFVETFADDEMNPLIKVWEKNEKANARRTMFSNIGAIEFHIEEQLQRAGTLGEMFPEGMPKATDRVNRPEKPKAKARRYSFNPGLMGEWLKKLDEYGQQNPQDIGIVKALEAQAHMGLRPGEIMNAPASALTEPTKRSKSWGFFLDTDTPGVKMDENLNIAVGPRTYEIMQQALNVSSANDRNLFVNPDGSPIGKGEMTRVAKLIKVPGIMHDDLTGTKLDNLQEAYDLRRMWVTLALNEFPGQGNRVGAAQGRAVGAVTGGGGAVKDYFSAVKGFYGDESTKVPFTIDEWLFEARVDELPERMQPPEGQRVSYKTDFTGPSLLPVFEDKDAPIQMGSLDAKTFAAKPKTDIIRPTAEPIQVSEAEAVAAAPAVKEGPSPELEDSLRRNNLNLGDIIANFGKNLPGPVKKALGPLGYGLTAAVASSTISEVEAATGSKTLAAVAGASEFGPVGYSDIRDIAAGRSEPDPFGMTPASRIAAEEQAGFIDLGRDRGPEAASANQDQGFLSR